MMFTYHYMPDGIKCKICHSTNKQVGDCFEIPSKSGKTSTIICSSCIGRMASIIGYGKIIKTSHEPHNLNRKDVNYLQQQEIEVKYGYSDPTRLGTNWSEY